MIFLVLVVLAVISHCVDHGMVETICFCSFLMEALFILLMTKIVYRLQNV